MKHASVLLAICFTIVSLCGFGMPEPHDVHISYCQSEITGNVFKCKVTYYRDDLLRAIADWKANVRSLPAAQQQAAMTDFVRDHFRVYSGNQMLAWSSIGKGENDKSVWFELRAESRTRLQSATIMHNALFHVYSDQMNLMVLKAGGSEYNYIFTPSRPTISVNLQAQP
ncbi:MAG TPA: DUF6702 family protein [Candidatus Kapabacteria bacterium]|nr:DUF6702 family protein [Candidatus Kapabacteria bacterium]